MNERVEFQPKRAHVEFPPDSKTSQLRESISSHPQVQLIGEIYKRGEDDYHEGMKIVTAAKIPNYNVDSLGVMLDGLAPFPKDEEQSRSYSDDYQGSFMLGLNGYIDVLGRIGIMSHRQVTVFDAAALRRININTSEKSWEESKNVERLTKVVLYPDMTAATYAYKYETATSKFAKRKGIHLADGFLEELLVKFDLDHLQILKQQVRDRGGIDEFLEGLASGEISPNPANWRDHNTIEHRMIRNYMEYSMPYSARQHIDDTLKRVYR